MTAFLGEFPRDCITPVYMGLGGTQFHPGRQISIAGGHHVSYTGGLRGPGRPEITYEGMIAETVRVRGQNDEMIDAYAARPLGGGPLPGVLVVHHMPGWDEWTREVVRKIAHHGFNAVSPNLHSRYGPGTAQERSMRVRESGGQVDAQVLADLGGWEKVFEFFATHLAVR
ncbi:MAG: hypothetical protein CL566_03145 [Alphaproteobacteria bacterium]|nr:hypothetical protein [Alphaproteobacteria bacterium]